MAKNVEIKTAQSIWEMRTKNISVGLLELFLENVDWKRVALAKTFW